VRFVTHISLSMPTAHPFVMPELVYHHPMWDLVSTLGEVVVLAPFGSIESASYDRYETGIIGFFFIAMAMGVLGLMMGMRGKEQGQERPRSSPV
jgi:hypothetical protein